MLPKNPQVAAFQALGVLFVGAIAACADSGGFTAERNLLVVVEESLHGQLRDRLEAYAETLRREQVVVHVQPWAPGSVEELRDFLFQHVDEHRVEGALLVGDLPAQWYEMEGSAGHEQFPLDQYLQDRDAIWVDQDGDDVPDFHTDLTLDIYTARLTGTVAQLHAYFDRVERYRNGGPLVDVSAFIFIDDDWANTDTSDLLGLGNLYGSVEVIQDPAESTRERYLARLAERGAEFVYQKVHSSPTYLLIDAFDAIEELHRQDVIGHNLKASFINMNNCFAARFTQSNLAEAYTVGTDYGLAIIGSTRKGAVRRSGLLHGLLTGGMHWGEAYRVWFNQQGKHDERWHLGIALMGDPLLVLTGDVFPSDKAAESFALVEDEEPLLPCCGVDLEPGTFGEYRRAHPEFFGPSRGAK